MKFTPWGPKGSQGISMAKVKLLQPVGTHSGIMEPGEFMEVTERLAAEWIATGVAEPAAPPPAMAAIRETFETATRKAAKRAR